jgi:tRNA-specific 2-thiouridylase
MRKVMVAISGGIDSAVAAALLKKANFDVIGVFMKLADLPRFKEGEKRAKNVAKVLKIPFLVLDLRKEFKKKIIDYFLDGYKKGITPNPCVVCNKDIKFGLFLEKALKLGADFVATGHYARKKEIRENSYPNSCRFAILPAKDKNRDQSYFLWMLNQRQLRKILFPIGDYTRDEVERLARKFKLPVLKARKSVEICFVKTTINDFLRKYLESKPGQIIDAKGKIVGEHKGLWFYTIGQRKGIGLPAGPYYVLDKDFKNNALIVTKNEKDLLKKELICKNVNWISGEEPKLPLKVKAKIRYRSQLASATIYHLKPKTYHLIFDRPQRAITPGQSIVFYSPAEVSTKAGKGQELLGGGIIC